MIASPKPRRGEIWTAHLEDAPKRHWVLVVSLDDRNLSNNTSSILVVPFGGYGEEGPTTISLPPGETGLPESSFLKAHFIQVLQKKNLLDPQRRMLSSTRMRQVVEMIRRSVDPDAQWARK